MEVLVLVVIILILAPLLIYLPIGVAKGNGHPNVGGVAALAVLGMFIAAMIWAYIGSRPAASNDELSSEGQSHFDIIATDAEGKQVKAMIEAADADEARYIAAERGWTIIGLRKSAMVAAPSSGAGYRVEGIDAKGAVQRFSVSAADESEAFALAWERGVKRIVKLERV